MPDEKLIPDPRTRSFALAMVALITCVLSFAGLTYLQRSRARWVAHGREVARVARDLRALVDEREADMLLRGGTPDAPPAIRADEGRQVFDATDRLFTLTADNPEQHARAESIRGLSRQWNGAVGAGSVRGATSADQRPAIVLFPALIREIAAFLDDEEQLYVERVRAESRVQLILLTSIPIELAIVAAILVAFRRSILSRTRRIATQAGAIEERNHRLALLSEQLSEQNEELRVHGEMLQTQAVELEEQTAEIEATLDELKTSEERFRTLVHSMPDAIVTMDTTGRYDALLGGWVERDGIDPTAWLGRTAAEVLGEEAGAVHRAAHERALRGEQVVYDWHTAAGPGQRFFTTSLSPLTDGKRGISGLVSVSRDITERHGKQRELEEALERLRHAQKMEAIGQLAGGVAHDFNNLLTIILAYADVLSEDSADVATLREATGEIRLAATRAAGLTRQLLAFSRRQELRPQPIDVNAVIEGVRRLIERLAGPEVRVRLALDPRVLPVMGDAGQLEQVIMNLAVNARDAMPAGGDLAIETRQVDGGDGQLAAEREDEGPIVEIQVRDTGTGMSEDTKSRMFEPFFTTKEIGQGTGLGLATVYGIVEQARGTIRVESALGEGSTFTIALPSHVEAVTRARAAALPPAVDLHEERVLVVDDEDAVRYATSRALRRVGYDVVAVGSGADALLALADAKGTIGTVVTDLYMPGMTGSELAREVETRFPECAIVIVSGYMRAASADAALSGRIVLVEKPFTLEAITSAVRLAQRARAESVTATE